MLLKGNELSMSYRDKEIFNSVNFEISEGEIIGLIGINGAGKTTLMRIMSGDLIASHGELTMKKGGIKVGYLPQSMTSEHVEVSSAFYRNVGHLGVDYNSEWRSGGEQTKEALAKVMANDYDLILLDEPTNHLDEEGLSWLVEKIRHHPATFVIISHDRYFLDQVATSIYSFEPDGFTTFYGNYTDYRNDYELRISSQLHEHNEHQKEVKRIQAEIKRLKSWSDKAHYDSVKKQKAGQGKKEYFRKKAKKKDQQIKSKIKQMEKKITEHEGPPTLQRDMVFTIFKEGNHRVKKIAEVNEVSLGYSNGISIANADFTWFNGEKIVVVGPNGSGKTTLVRTMLGELEPLSGRIYVTPNANVGYLSQDRLTLDEELSVIDQFEVENYQAKGAIVEALDNLGINYKMTHQLVKTLSFGEKLKVNLLLLMTQGCDGLILDEPTNHLDLLSREELESVLKQFPGGILAISHDQYFINAIGSHLLIFENYRFIKYEGTYDEYQKKKSVSKGENRLLESYELSAIVSRMSEVDINSNEYQELAHHYKKLTLKKSSN